MAVTTRAGLKNYCLRKLGDPVIEINVDDDQVEDRIDEAIETFQEFHNEATFRNYVGYQLTSTDVANGYITIADSIIQVTKLFPVDSSFINSTNMFSFKYQFAMSDFHTLADFSGGLSYYEQMREYLSLIDMTLNGTPQVTFSRRQNRLYIWGDFVDGDLKTGDYICFECYQLVDPSAHSSVYNNIFLKEYATVLIKEQWGQNMSKFEGMQLPGGVTINGRQILEDAKAEKETLRERMRLEYEMPPDFLVG